MELTTLTQLISGFTEVINFIVNDLFVETVIKGLFLNPDLTPVVVFAIGVPLAIMVLKMFNPIKIMR